jgi:hypothetical protein
MSNLLPKLTTTCVAALLASAAAAEPGIGPAPERGERCRTWETHISVVIEQHRKDGTSRAALDRAIDLAYAGYAECVMWGDRHLEEKAVAVREVLSSGRALAATNQ